MTHLMLVMKHWEKEFRTFPSGFFQGNLQKTNNNNNNNNKSLIRPSVNEIS